jgi:hypothetical protein
MPTTEAKKLILAIVLHTTEGVSLHIRGNRDTGRHSRYQSPDDCGNVSC